MADARQYGRIVDLITVKVQDRQNRTIADRIDELVAVPARRQRSGFGLAVAHHHQRDQVGMIEDCSISMGEAVPKLPALVNATRCFGSCVAANPSGKTKLL